MKQVYVLFQYQDFSESIVCGIYEDESKARNDAYKMNNELGKRYKVSGNNFNFFDVEVWEVK